MNDDLVSIIIPVYNVQKYINKCLKSVVTQTYKKIEIIIINDGSTDKSAILCKKWARYDKRIVFISKQNEGVGFTRNYGMKISHGKYLMFIDPDDWVDKRFVEIMYYNIKKNDADMAECNFYRINMEDESISYVNVNCIFYKEFSIKERMIFGLAQIWKIIVKRELIINNNILFPDTIAEDVAVYPLIVSSCNRIVSVMNYLYYYRKYRKASITNSSKNYFELPRALSYLFVSFKNIHLYCKYKHDLYSWSIRWLGRYLVPALTKLNRFEYKKLESSYKKFLKIFKTDYNDINVLILGSYNLTRIANKSNFLENPYNRIQFSSIISLMSSFDKTIKMPNHKNAYRDYMLKREFKRKFFDILNEEHFDYIIIDFIEERHNIIKINDNYYTYSDALQESDFNESGEIIYRNSKICQLLWQKSCMKFIFELKRRFVNNHVILIENYLAEQYSNGIDKYNFDNIEQIKSMNNILQSCYKFFKKNYSGIQDIDLHMNKNYIVDNKYEYGCHPWHLNDLINLQIADKINI